MGKQRSLGLSAIVVTVALSTLGPVAGVQGAQELSLASRPSPFANCDISTFGLPGEPNYLNAEVEPMVAVNPRNPRNIIGVWQQDRWRSGGARGLVTGVSQDGGETWTRNFPHFSLCAGGNAQNNGNYERSSDPWVTFSPNGTAHQIALPFDFNKSLNNNGVTVSRSTNEGRTWSEPIALIADTAPTIVDDKETITADPKDSRFVYAVWDRLVFTDLTQSVIVRGPTWFARTSNGGRTWEPAKMIYDPGLDAQTISNQIVVLPDGTLVNMMLRLLHDNESPAEPGLNSNPSDAVIAVIRSTDKGLTWSAPFDINPIRTIGIIDPKTMEPLRTGDIIPEMAVDNESGALYVIWQDARFSNLMRDGIAFSKSTDGGLSWSVPVQINKAHGVQAFTASVHVAEDGAIGVTYYDFRHDNADPAVLLTDYWKIVSHNGGKTWSESHVAGPFDMRTAPVARGFFLGDYEGLANLENKFLPFFVMTNSSNLNNRTDVFAALPREGDDEGGDGGSTSGLEQVNTAPRSAQALVASHRENSARR